MKKIYLKLQNCYGIGKLEHTFDYSKNNTILIYAPNGTMKTSLAKTLSFFGDEIAEAPSDRIYPDRKPTFELKFDDIEIKTKHSILVVNPESNNYDSSHRISSFVASKELKQKYDAIYSELDNKKTDFIKKLKSISQSTDCETEFLKTFTKKNGNDNFFDLLCEILPILNEKQTKYSFRYNDIFDSKGNVQKFLEKNKEFLNTYIENYDLLVSKSDFFKKSNNTFGTYQASEILKSIEDDSFFEAGHVLELSNNTKIESATQLKELLDNEVNKIVNDKELKKIFDKVDKAIGANAELRAFKKVIEKDNLLLIELNDYENFKKKVWLGYLNELKDVLSTICDFYNLQKAELKKILSESKKEFKIWEDLVNKFNTRFHIPFKVILTNQEDVILKQERANLEFLYCDRNEPPVQQKKEVLFNNLSKGEQKAYYILQLLFEVESRRSSAEEILIVFDDIADSFDYKNKYAIIEYIKDIHESNSFKILILTHNFDFYRTVASRLYLPRDGKSRSVLMATRNDLGVVSLLEGQYVNDAFKHLLGRISEPKVFISLLPFLRNLIEYTEIAESEEYMKLTKCLHIKEDSDEININDIINIWKPRFKNLSFEKITFGEEKIIEMIHKIADDIILESEKSIDEISLENKIVLAIATRLKAEEFMIKSIEGLDLKSIPQPQTPKIFSKYKESKGRSEQSLKILDKVILMTPENIHLNAFMYEPLVDISIWHLITLYKEINSI